MQVPNVDFHKHCLSISQPLLSNLTVFTFAVLKFPQYPKALHISPFYWRTSQCAEARVVHSGGQHFSSPLVRSLLAFQGLDPLCRAGLQYERFFFPAKLMVRKIDCLWMYNSIWSIWKVLLKITSICQKLTSYLHKTMERILGDVNNE